MYLVVFFYLKALLITFALAQQKYYEYTVEETTPFPPGIIGRYVAYDGMNYYTKLNVGSPGEALTLLLDTTSYYSLLNIGSMSKWPTFEPKSSSTFEYDEEGGYFLVGTENSISAKGIWGSDIVLLAGVEFLMRFGLSVEGLNPQIFGLGTKQVNCLEKYILTDGIPSEPVYPHVLEALKKSGKIVYKGFSLWLAGEGQQSTLLFGGIDTEVFHPQLIPVPLLNVQENFRCEFSRTTGVQLKSIVVESNVLKVDKVVLLDTSSQYSVLPLTIISDLLPFFIWSVYNGTFFWVPCNTSKQITLNFDGVQITILSPRLLIKDHHGRCRLSFKGQKNGPFTLGSMVLKELYLVFDYEGYKVAIASAKQRNEVTRHSYIVISTGIPKPVLREEFVFLPASAESEG